MPEVHPNERPGLLQSETPSELGARAELLVSKHVEYIKSFGQVRKQSGWQASCMGMPFCSRFSLCPQKRPGLPGMLAPSHMATPDSDKAAS